MAQYFDRNPIFKHRQPISLENMQGFTIFGTNGAFKDFVKSYGNDPDCLTVGVGIEINTTGDILGSRLLVCGGLPETKLNTADLFPDAPTAGKAVF